MRLSGLRARAKAKRPSLFRQLRGGPVHYKLQLMVLVVLTLALRAGGDLRAQGVPGVSSKEIVIGSCSALEGPSHALGRQQIQGAQAYFNLINDEGGVDGRKLRLVAYDDSYDPAKTETCFKRLQSQNVFAMGFFVGTPTAVKYLPMAEEAKIPLVGLFTGAQTLYTPLRHWIINIRASYGDETREQGEGLWKGLGYRKIAVIYPDDAFGATAGWRKGGTEEQRRGAGCHGNLPETNSRG
jgi:branched-chain amino acid transport system substrate-binding protein